MTQPESELTPSAPADAALERAVQAIFVEEFELLPERVQPEARLHEDLGLDSLDAVNLIVALEKAFGIVVDEAEAKRLESVSAVTDYVHGALRTRLTACA
jgi:acyl carrier protein